LRGQAIRETAARLLAASPGAAAPVHYRRVVEVVKNAGYAIAGADPDAVLLTQLTRSPVLRKAGRPGEYQIDFNAPDRLRARLGVLQADLRQLSDTRIDPSESARARENRQRIVTELAHNEKALAEALRCLKIDERQPNGRIHPADLAKPAPRCFAGEGSSAAIPPRASSTRGVDRAHSPQHTRREPVMPDPDPSPLSRGGPARPGPLTAPSTSTAGGCRTSLRRQGCGCRSAITATTSTITARWWHRSSTGSLGLALMRVREELVADVRTRLTALAPGH
jgi:hypothetical protein